MLEHLAVKTSRTRGVDSECTLFLITECGTRIAVLENTLEIRDGVQGGRLPVRHVSNQGLVFLPQVAGHVVVPFTNSIILS